MIRLAGVTVRLDTADGPPVTAVADLDLAVAAGEVLALVGPSGCGKTTTLRTINRLVTPAAGLVEVGGRDVRDLDPIGLRRGIGYVIQAAGLFPHLTVRRNVALLCEVEGWDPDRARARTDELLELVGLPPTGYAARYPAELSGGQAQRVAIARALALDPPIVLLDEPFGALDPITRRQLQDAFVALRARLAKTMVIVSHDLEEAFRLADRVAVLEHGRLAQVGTPAELRSAPASAFVEEFVGSALRA